MIISQAWSVSISIVSRGGFELHNFQIVPKVRWLESGHEVPLYLKQLSQQWLIRAFVYLPTDNALVTHKFNAKTPSSVDDFRAPAAGRHRKVSQSAPAFVYQSSAIGGGGEGGESRERQK